MSCSDRICLSLKFKFQKTTNTPHVHCGMQILWICFTYGLKKTTVKLCLFELLKTFSPENIFKKQPNSENKKKSHFLHFHFRQLKIKMVKTRWYFCKYQNIALCFFASLCLDRCGTRRAGMVHFLFRKQRSSTRFSSKLISMSFLSVTVAGILCFWCNFVYPYCLFYITVSIIFKQV